MDRRQMLARLPLFGAAVALPLASVTAPAFAAENPDLLRLGEMLPATEAEFLAAEAAEGAIVRKWAPRWPLAPDALTLPWRSAHHWERDLTGVALTRKGEKDPRPIEPAEDIQRVVDELSRAIRRKRKNPFGPINWRGQMVSVDELETMRAGCLDRYAVAAAYEAEKLRVRNASGHEAALNRRHRASEDLAQLIMLTLEQPAETMAGVAIKARAVAALGKVNIWVRMLHTDAGTKLAADVLRIAGQL